ncbi:hypothetical protein HAT86_16300 [Roseovarius gahaiensis]|uniref:Uncharacterized protein n=1 Tax=Roseovarius gahaiensis TaxID=2716691 RepID=A0A967EG22_9RHOB|nr:hypothetical protein [Roseovarius gahaiensis]NHQ76008.1 hypothetical protein [Roseovarius gahaiensis]
MEVGDVVEIEAADGTVEYFRIDRRCWRFGAQGGPSELVLRLDWPASR